MKTILKIRTIDAYGISIRRETIEIGYLFYSKPKAVVYIIVRKLLKYKINTRLNENLSFF